MKFDEFRDEAEGTSRTLGRNFKVSLTFEGDGAFTDRTRVNLPMLPDELELSDKTVRVTRGYIDHEASGHQRHTDLDSMDAIHDWATRENKHAVPKIANAMEDIRIEPRVIREYPGSKKNLEATTDAVCQLFLADYATEGGENYDPEIWESKLPMLPLVMTWIGRKIAGYESKALDECLSKIDPDIRREAEKWATEAMACEDTWSIFSLAKRCFAENYEEEKEEEEEQSGTEPTDKKGGGGEGKGDNEGEEGNQPNVGEIANTETETKGEDIVEIDPSIVIQKMFDNEARIGKAGGKFRSYSNARDIVVTRKGCHFMNGKKYRHGKWEKRLSQPASDYGAHVQALGNVIGTMKRKLERGLADKVARGRDTGKEYGALDTRRLVQAYAGMPNVYWTPEDVPDMNTAVELLIDLSGSMSGFKVHTAMLTTICLCEALNSIGIPFEVTGFSSDGTLNTWNRADASRFHRIDNECYFVFKDFSDSLRESKGSIASMRRCIVRNNCDGVSVAWSGRRLLKRPEAKKVMCVLSDGQPAFYVGNDVDREVAYQYLPDVVRGLGDRGIDLIGIGICDSAVGRYYPKYVVLSEVSDLPGEIMNQIAKMLLGERVVLDNSALLKASSLGHRRVA